MTDQRPGRKALFVGAPAAAGRSSPDEIAQHVRQLNEDLALALKGAAARKAVKPLDASQFGSEYSTLVDAVNTALVQLESTASGAPAPAGTPAAGSEEFVKKIDVLERRLEFMEKNNPVPMLISTPSFDIIEANAAYLAMSGIPESEILKTNIHNFAITGRAGEGAKVALEQKRRAVGELTITFPSGVHTLEQYCNPGARQYRYGHLPCPPLRRSYRKTQKERRDRAAQGQIGDDRPAEPDCPSRSLIPVLKYA